MDIGQGICCRRMLVELFSHLILTISLVQGCIEFFCTVPDLISWCRPTYEESSLKCYENASLGIKRQSVGFCAVCDNVQVFFLLYCSSHILVRHLPLWSVRCDTCNWQRWKIILLCLNIDTLKDKGFFFELGCVILHTLKLPI